MTRPDARVARSGASRLSADVRATTTDDDETTVATRQERFTSFCTEVEPRLRRALVAAYGPDLGSDAAADAFAWAWEHFDRVDDMANPAGYLWRVGQTSSAPPLAADGGQGCRTGPTTRLARSTAPRSSRLW